MKMKKAIFAVERSSFKILSLKIFVVPAEQVTDPEAVAARITLTTDSTRPAESFGRNLLIIEAISEVLPLKQALFKELA